MLPCSYWAYSKQSFASTATVNSGIYSPSRKPQGKKAVSTICMQQPCFRWTFATTLPSLGLRQSKRVRLNWYKQILSFTCLLFFTNYFICFWEPIKDHIVPWISLKHFKTIGDTDKMSAHTAENTIMAKQHKPESNKPRTPVPRRLLHLQRLPLLLRPLLFILHLTHLDFHAREFGH